MIAETTRLLIRELEPGDAPALHPVFSDPQATRFTLRIHTDVSATLAWIEAVRKGYRKHGFGPWAVFRSKDLLLLGYCGCGMILLNDKKEIEVGYRIVPSCWGQDYATEALSACIDYAFTRLSINRLVALIQHGNSASIRVAEKSGMKYQQEVLYEGVPMRLYEISADTEENVQSSFPP